MLSRGAGADTHSLEKHEQTTTLYKSLSRQPFSRGTGTENDALEELEQPTTFLSSQSSQQGAERWTAKRDEEHRRQLDEGKEQTRTSKSIRKGYQMLQRNRTLADNCYSDT